MFENVNETGTKLHRVINIHSLPSLIKKILVISIGAGTINMRGDSIKSLFHFGVLCSSKRMCAYHINHNDYKPTTIEHVGWFEEVPWKAATGQAELG